MIEIYDYDVPSKDLAYRGVEPDFRSLNFGEITEVVLIEPDSGDDIFLKLQITRNERFELSDMRCVHARILNTPSPKDYFVAKFWLFNDSKKCLDERSSIQVKRAGPPAYVPGYPD